MERINLAFIMWKPEFRELLVDIFEIGEMDLFKVLYSSNKVINGTVKELPKDTVFIIDEMFKQNGEYVSGADRIKAVMSLIPDVKILCMTSFEVTATDRKNLTDIGVKDVLHRNMRIEEMKAVIMQVAGVNPEHPCNPLFVDAQGNITDFGHS